MKKILLIRPPDKPLPHRKRPMVYFPLGLLQIASVLIEKGYDVNIIDGVMPEKEIEKEGENFFGITFEEMRERIAQKDFDIVGISAQFTFQWPNAIKMAKVRKEVNPNCIIIMGGAHASVMYEDIVKKYNFIDVVVRGEGEYVMSQLADRIRNKKSFEGIPGIAYKVENNVFASESRPIDDLDSLPLPAYHLIDIEKYFLLTKRYFTRTAYTFKGWERGMTLITSRGCPFNCIFCSIHLHMGKKWRAHSQEYVLRHIDYLIKNYKVKYIHFEDDNFSLDPTRCEAILDGIIHNKWDIRWDIPNGVRVDTFNESLLRKCKVSGVTHLIFGIESGVQRVLTSFIGKNIKLSKAEEILLKAKRIGVDTRAFYIMGLPGETKADIRASVKYALRLMWKYECFGGFSMAVPFLGTEMYDICEKKGYFYLEPSIENLSAAYLNQGIIKTEEFAPDFLMEITRSFKKKVPLLLFLIFLRKLLGDYYLIRYILKNIFKIKPRNWSSIYYKVIYFHNALVFDMEKNVRRDGRQVGR